MIDTEHLPAPQRFDPSAPLVSIIIVTCDREDDLSRALSSIFEQDYRPIEIILIDNESKIPLDVGEPPEGFDIKLLRRDAKGLTSQTRNQGLEAAAGEFIGFLDDDDYYLPGKIRKTAKFLMQNPNIDYVIGRTKMLKSGEQFATGQPSVEMSIMLYERTVQLNATLMRKRLFETLKFDEQLSACVDLDLTVRIFEQFRVATIDDVVSVWNLDGRPDQITTRRWRRSYENWKRLCEKHSRHIERYPRVTRFYYGKMLALSLMYIDIRMILRIAPPLFASLFRK